MHWKARMDRGTKYRGYRTNIGWMKMDGYVDLRVCKWIKENVYEWRAAAQSNPFTSLAKLRLMCH
jgi:hypothetical protein